MTKTAAFFADQARALGLTVERIVETKHIKLYLRAPDGRAMVAVFAKTTSDHRALKNSIALLRRFARGA